MGLNADVFRLLDVNAPARVMGSFQEGQERQNKLAQLAQAQELGDMQLAQAKQAQIANAQAVKQKHVQELAGRLSQGYDISRHQIGAEIIRQEAKQRGLSEQDVEPLLSIMGKDNETAKNELLYLSNPDEYRKQQIAAKFKTAKGMAQLGQRGQIVMDSEGNAININPYTNEAQYVYIGGKKIKAAQYTPELQGQISGSKAAGTEIGKSTAEAKSTLQDIESQMPHLEELTKKLSDLGKAATYTKTGQLIDYTRRELGLGVGEGAVARKKYMSTVDNEILPLLRQTFGAAFTQKEGESLRATLGDPNVSPEEKDAVLQSFIEAKKAQVKSLKRRTGEPSDSIPTNTSGWSIKRIP